MKHLLIVGLLIFSLNTFGQSSADTLGINDTVFETVDTYPGYPGGLPAMLKFIEKNLKYPKKARANGINGKVIVGFVIEKDGQIIPDNIKVEQGLDTLLDEEAIRVVRLMPKWIPAQNDGQIVRCRTRLPIMFR